MPTARRLRAPQIVIALAVAATAIVSDQLTKLWAVAALSESSRVPLIGDILGLQLAFNSGMSFSLGAGLTPLITGFALVASAALLVAILRTRSLVMATALGLILGGAIGNIIDRFATDPGWGNGTVTDFLAYGDAFIGNLADVLVGAGVVLGLLASFHKRPSLEPTSPNTAGQTEGE